MAMRESLRHLRPVEWKSDTQGLKPRSFKGLIGATEVVP
jgi:hypothetical protein